MEDKETKRYCPDCRNRMKFVKTENKETMFEIWNCLNCHELWEFEQATGNWIVNSLKPLEIIV